MRRTTPALRSAPAPAPALLAFLAALAILVATLAPSATAAPSFTDLEPGARADLRERVPVQFVFVGYEPDEVNQQAFLSALPTSYRPVIRSRLWYGITERLGITYTYDYRMHWASQSWENSFFGALSRMGKPAPLTLFQEQYNAQRRNVLDVTDNHEIDAPSVEKWLIDHAPAGVDTRRNTIFFINWWGRDDFEHHVYTKKGEVDPDTGFDFGAERQSRRMIAWGGTTPDDEETGLGARGERRVWFYDLSAGPESWTDNWNVDRKDIDGDGLADYRMPAIWEYTAGGYRSPLALTGDLAKVARYVGINLLFTSSPLYPPALTPPRMPASINLDVNVFEGIEGVNASEQLLDRDLLRDEIAEVHRVPYTVDVQDLAADGPERTCLIRYFKGTRCYRDRPQYPASANLFLDTALNLDRYQDGGGAYEGIFMSYAVPFESPLLGFADDNWIDGTQSGTFNFIDPVTRDVYGYGLTTTMIHEYGHHFGMSHPHDGWDSERGIDYGPSGPFYFAWSGDETNSIMSYIDLNWDYSQFDRDNANRFQAAAYITNANGIAAKVLASDNLAAGLADLRAADRSIGLAKAAMAGHDYVAAFDHANAAFASALAAARNAGVRVEASTNGWYVLPPRRDYKGPVAKQPYAYKDPIGAGTHRARP